MSNQITINSIKQEFIPIPQILFSLCGGILMGLTPAPQNLWFLAWVAFVPLWLLIIDPKLTLKQILLIAVAWGFGYHGLALFWITGVHPMTWMGVPWLASLAIAVFCWLLITFWGTALVIIWSVLMTLLTKSKNKIKKQKGSYLLTICLRVLLGVALWCILEKLYSYTPLWWNSLSYTQSPNNLIILQLSKFSGSTTVTGAIIAVNGLLAEAFFYSQKNKNKFNICCWWLLPFTLCFGLHIIGYYYYQSKLVDFEQNKIKVGIIQGNIPNEIKLYSNGWNRAIAGYTNGYKNLADRGVDIVLTPETALPFLWDSSYNHLSFYQAILDKKVPAWVGTFAQKGDRLSNTLFTITDTGDIFSRYDKVKLVPLGEFIPFESILGDIVDLLSPLDARRAAGEPNQIFDTPLGRAIVGICYDSAFSEHFRRQAAQGGEFIISAANNAHYSSTMPAQHHALDVMRAIESDRWAARATNTGYSAIVDPRGHSIWISDLNVYQIHSDTIYRRQTQTLYVRWGDWLTPALLILSAIALISNRGLRIGNW